MTSPHMLHVTDGTMAIVHPDACTDTASCVFAAAEPDLPGDRGWIHEDGFLIPAGNEPWTAFGLKPGRYVITYDAGWRVPWRIQHGLEPEPRVATRFHCLGCGKGYARKPDAVSHMGRCWKLSANRGCKTCTHFEPGGSEADEHGYTYAQWDDACGQPDGPAIDGPIIGCPLWEQAPWQVAL